MKSLPLINPKQEANKIINFLKKTFKEQKIDKVVFGLSGGIDSTTVLYLLKKALPKKNIYAVQMDYKPRKKFKIDLEEVNVVDVSIKKIVDDLKDEVSGIFSLSRGAHPTERREGRDSCVIKISLPSLVTNKVRLGNIMARVRMIILFDLAKQINGLVCGTENKSERLLGYFTRFGDSASDIEPISHLYKTQVRQLADYLKVLKKIIDQSPTAGLWDGQTDEKEFGFSYKEADQVLYHFEQSHRHSRPRSESRAGSGGNPEHQALGPLLQGDDIKHIKTLCKKIKKDLPNAEKIIKRVRENQFKLITPYHV